MEWSQRESEGEALWWLEEESSEQSYRARGDGASYTRLPRPAHLTVLMTDYDAIDKLHDLVSNNGNLQHDTAAVNIRAMALISRLKALNRTANAATRIAKEGTAQSRLDMDQSHLGLQNLLYEKRHLEREIEKCRQFASVSSLSTGVPLSLTHPSSIYQDVPLYSLEDFKRLAPEGAHTDDVLSDGHQLMLNRLSFELAERQRYDNLPSLHVSMTNLLRLRLDQKKKELVLQKEELLKESKSKSTTMDSVKSQIDVLMKVRLSYPQPRSFADLLVSRLHPIFRRK